MGQMSFKKNYFLWIAAAVIFFFLFAGEGDFFGSLLMTGIIIGVLYLLFILLAKLFG